MKQSTSEIESQEVSSNQQIYFPSTDEFGGYSSRLRLQQLVVGAGNAENINQSSQTSTCPSFADPNLEFNLCDLLGIDIDAKALKIAMADKLKKQQAEDVKMELSRKSV